MKRVDVIATAKQKSRIESTPQRAGRRRGGWRSSLASLPGIGASLLPVGICPACWPAYAGLLSSLGFGFLLKTAYLLPLTAAFLLIAVVSLAYKASTRRGYGPFLLGLLASTIMLIGKFVLKADTAMYGGIAVLIAASLWNAWPRKKDESVQGACPACAPTGQTSQLLQAGAPKDGKEMSP